MAGEEGTFCDAWLVSLGRLKVIAALVVSANNLRSSLRQRKPSLRHMGVTEFVTN